MPCRDRGDRATGDQVDHDHGALGRRTSRDQLRPVRTQHQAGRLSRHVEAAGDLASQQLDPGHLPCTGVGHVQGRRISGRHQSTRSPAPSALSVCRQGRNRDAQDRPRLKRSPDPNSEALHLAIRSFQRCRREKQAGSSIYRAPAAAIAPSRRVWPWFVQVAEFARIRNAGKPPFWQCGYAGCQFPGHTRLDTRSTGNGTMHRLPIPVSCFQEVPPCCDWPVCRCPWCWCC